MGFVESRRAVLYNETLAKRRRDGERKTRNEAKYNIGKERYNTLIKMSISFL